MAVNLCLHQREFFCTTVSLDEGVTHAFACVERCGYWLPFNPLSAAMFRDKPACTNQADDHWKGRQVLTFLPYPNPDVNWKVGPALSKGGKY